MILSSPLLVYAIKSVKQSFSPSTDLLAQMETFREIMNDCVRIGLDTGASSMQRLSSLSYQSLRKMHLSSSLPSCYYLTAISTAAGMLVSRRKSIKRQMPTRDPYLKRPLLVSCYNFKITDDGIYPVLGRKKAANEDLA